MPLDQRSCVAPGTKAQREDIPRARWAMGRARLVVLGCEVGRRSTEASSFLSAFLVTVGPQMLCFSGRRHSNDFGGDR